VDRNHPPRSLAGSITAFAIKKNTGQACKNLQYPGNYGAKPEDFGRINSMTVWHRTEQFAAGQGLYSPVDQLYFRDGGWLRKVFFH